MPDNLDFILSSEPNENSDNTNARPSALPIVRRYRDTYRVATALVAIGNTIKILGAIVAAFIFFGSLSLKSSLSGGESFWIGGTFFAVIVGTLFWVCGVIVAAQGQILRATLDNTVANSPFLNDQERLDSMGLPRSIANR